MLAPNAVLQNRYLIKRSIGQGGMGAVYEALDQRFDGIVAVKETLHTDEQARKAFEREARLLYGLRHPALPRVIDHFLEDDGQFLVMDYIQGDDLEKARQQNGGRFDTARVLAWADRLLEALEYLHSQQPPIIHRDIKPQNLKLTPRGEVILLDFGLAKGSTTQATHNTTGASIVGYTPNYAPLEQIRGAGTDARSDVFSLAATMYILLTGMIPPDVITRVAEVHSGLPDPLKPANLINSQVPAPVAAVLSSAMMINREHRIQSAGIMRQQLRDANSQILSTTGEAATVYVQTPSGRQVPAEPKPAPAQTPIPQTSPANVQSRVPPPNQTNQPNAPLVQVPTYVTPEPMPAVSQGAVAAQPATQNPGANKPATGAVFSRASVPVASPVQPAPQQQQSTSQRTPSQRTNFGAQQTPSLRPAERGKSKGRMGLVVIVLVVLIGGAAAWYFLLNQPATGSAGTDSDSSASSSGSSSGTSDDVAGTVFQHMSPAEHLAAAKKLIKDGARQTELSRARDHLNTIPDNAPESKEGKALLQDIESRMRNLTGSGSSGKKGR